MKYRKKNYFVCADDGNTYIFRTYSTADYFRNLKKDKITSFTEVILAQREGAGNQYREE